MSILPQDLSGYDWDDLQDVKNAISEELAKRRNDLFSQAYNNLSQYPFITVRTNRICNQEPQFNVTITSNMPVGNIKIAVKFASRGRLCYQLSFSSRISNLHKYMDSTVYINHQSIPALLNTIEKLKDVNAYFANEIEIYAGHPTIMSVDSLKLYISTKVNIYKAYIDFNHLFHYNGFSAAISNDGVLSKMAVVDFKTIGETMHFYLKRKSEQRCQIALLIKPGNQFSMVYEDTTVRAGEVPNSVELPMSSLDLIKAKKLVSSFMNQVLT